MGESYRDPGAEWSEDSSARSVENTYTIIGTDGLQYGPVNSATLQSWASMGRVTSRTLVTSTSPVSKSKPTKFLSYRQALSLPSIISQAFQPVNSSGNY